MHRTTRVSILILGLLGVASRSHGAIPTMAPEELKPGQKAVVKTVFEGQKVETFDAEIVGVLKGGASEGDMILARATTDRVKHTGIAQGMSGSPVYVDGKLVGALSGGWSFMRDPLFVVTPIGEMLGTLRSHGDESAEVPATTGPGGLAAGAAAFGEFHWPGSEPPVPGSTSPPASAPMSTSTLGGTPTPLAVPVSCAGLSPALLPLATSLLQPLGLTAVPGGVAPASAALAPFEPGSAVAVELMRGDLRLAAIGTVTWRDGDHVLIFGHPFFQAGPVRLPLSSATITTIVASDLTSFKLGSAGPPVGTATQDRRAAVAGTVGATPKLMPMSLVLADGVRTRRVFHFESIEDRSLAPQLMSLAAVNGLLESGGSTPSQTLRWTMTLHRHGAPPLALSDVVVSDNPVGDLQGAIAAPLRFLYNNPYQRLALDSVSVRVETVGERNTWSLRSAQLLAPTVRPGGDVHVRCDLERWRGGHETASFTLHVPEEVPAGRYLVWVGGGPELSRREASRLPGRYRPSTLDEAWSRLADWRSSDGLHAALLARAPEVTRAGRDYPELPTSAMALLAGSQEAEDASRRGSQANLDQVDRRFDGQVRGELQLEVDVDPAAP
jgi:SpoIVB peptidase S55